MGVLRCVCVCVCVLRYVPGGGCIEVCVWRWGGEWRCVYWYTLQPCLCKQYIPSPLSSPLPFQTQPPHTTPHDHPHNPTPTTPTPTYVISPASLSGIQHPATDNDHNTSDICTNTHPVRFLTGLLSCLASCAIAAVASGSSDEASGPSLNTDA